VDLRIGVTHTPREIDLQLPDDTDRDALRSEIAEVLASESSVLWVTDRCGSVVGVPAARIAYIELGADGAGRSIGFSS